MAKINRFIMSYSDALCNVGFPENEDGIKSTKTVIRRFVKVFKKITPAKFGV